MTHVEGARHAANCDPASRRFAADPLGQPRGNLIGHPPGHCHGGIIATILDEAMGKVNKLRQVVALTSEITVSYLKPVPLNKPLRVESREEKVTGRRDRKS